MMVLKCVGWFFSSFILIYSLWLGFFVAVGAFTKKIKYPEALPQNIAVIICARNEETVIGRLIDSLMKQDYPRDNFKIFTVAHNCTDRTAEIAKACGSTVFFRNDPTENKKICALRYGLQEVCHRYPGYFTAYVVFDADSTADRGYLKEINNALASGADVASGYYSSINFDRNIISRLTGTLYYTLMQCNSMPHNRLGLPVNVYGSGYGARMETVSYLDSVETLVEDFEFSIQTVLHGGKMVAAPNAIFYAEMPTTLKEGLLQRLRWAAGDTQCFRKYRKQLFNGLSSLKISGFKMFMDLIMNLVITITFFGVLCNIVAAVITGITALEVRIFLLELVVFYCIFALGAAVTLIQERKPLRDNAGTIALFPLWVFVSALFGFITMFMKTVAWHQTAREGDTSKSKKGKNTHE